MNEVFAFEVGVKGTNWAQIINHRSRGKAKAEYLSSVRETYPDVKFTDLTCKKVGEPVTSLQFKRNAAYRGLPEVLCGRRVKVGKATGVIIGHNSSANFDILFDANSPQYADLVLNCHPATIKLE